MLARTAERRVDEFTPQELANMAWAFATVGGPNSAAPSDARSDAIPGPVAWQSLFRILARTAERQIYDFKPQELVKIAWAFAHAGHPNKPLFAAVARGTEYDLDELSAQALTRLAWAFATVEQSDKNLFRALAGVAKWRVREFRGQELATMAWALARAGESEAALLMASAGRVHVRAAGAGRDTFWSS
eukprot:gnl/TRDRNA2_/TRDRNA2_142653_c0_seq1.p1 gnl/TRDRNA2_/TRDRNA2_142653_c0~~gnl/TRDRNA2_/TRDRNA2_142653_c0_seq1.p1  ORF type:complete len:188 (-),score=33.15 gnl/TRDRNA2_/TRDRNA2_142653_c0_seq1:72-635(-)